MTERLRRNQMKEKLPGEAEMSLRELNQKALDEGLRRVQSVCDVLDLPAFVIGDEHDGSVIYGIIIGSRELAAAIVGIEEGMCIAGMISSASSQQAKNDLN
jgi:hypothetical protein